MTIDPLHEAAFRASANDGTRIGSRLERHRLVNGWTWPELAEKLGIDVPRLAKLALCAVPKEATFADDVTVIAFMCGVSPTVLAAALREVEAHRNWDDVQASATGWMLAAHDAKQPPPRATDDPAGT